MNNKKILKALGDIEVALHEKAQKIEAAHDGKLIGKHQRNPWLDYHSLLDAASEVNRALQRVNAYSEGEEPPLFEDDSLRKDEGI